MNVNITQLRRLVIRRWNKEDNVFDVLTVEPDSLGQDTIMELNIAPRKRERASSIGTTSTPVNGTYDSFSGSITFLFDNYQILGTLLNRFNKATYAGAAEGAGNVIGGGDNLDFCAGSDYVSVIAQGICDDGSSADVELPRCIPSVDDAISIGTNETSTITLQLNPVIYNASLHENDGLPHYDYRLGDYDTETKMRLNVATGEYEEVTDASA